MRRSLIYILPAFLISTCCLSQSPWVPEKGKGSIHVGYTSIGPYTNLFSNEAGIKRFDLSREVTDRTLQLYGEWSPDTGTSIVSSVPIKFMTAGNETFALQSVLTSKGTFATLGNIQLAIRRNFINKGVLLSSQFTLELPTSQFDPATGLRSGLNAVSIIPTVSVGKGWSALYGYISAGLAVRSGQYSGEFRSEAELGYRIIRRIYIAGVSRLVVSFKNGSVTEPPEQLQSGLYLNNQSFWAYGMKVTIGITDNWGVSGGYYSAFFGNRVALAPSLNVGTYYTWH